VDPAAPAAPCGSGAAQTVDITPRRVQRFDVVSGTPHAWSIWDIAAGNRIVTGTVAPDADGLLTVPAVNVLPTGTRVTLQPLPLVADVASFTATLAGQTITLTWTVDAVARGLTEWIVQVAQSPTGPNARLTTVAAHAPLTTTHAPGPGTFAYRLVARGADDRQLIVGPVQVITPSNLVYLPLATR